MIRAPLSLLLLSAVALADDPPCTPTPATASVEVNFKKGTSQVKDLAAWYRKITCHEIEAPLSAAEAPLTLTIEGKISAPRVIDVVRSAAASAGYEVQSTSPNVRLQKIPEVCDPVKARAALEKLASLNCALNLDVFGAGECLDSRVTLTAEKEGPKAFRVAQLKTGSLLYALGLREGDVLPEDSIVGRAVEPHFELNVTRGETKKTLRCEVTGESTRLHPLSLLIRESVSEPFVAGPCTIDPSLITTRGDTVEVDAKKAPGLDFSCLMQSSRIVPAYKDGKAQGFKLFSIRPTSLLGLLGLQNGDTLKTINGRELDTPDKALEIYSALRNEKKFTIAVERRGEPKTLIIVLK